MIICETLQAASSLLPPYGLTIGSFDGLHLGHQLLIHELKKRGTVAVLTFSNHPSSILKNRVSLPLITPLEQKISLLKKAGVDLLFLLPFSLETAQKPYDVFLEEIRAVYPFTLLVVGEGDAFGKGRQGDAVHVTKLGKEWGFEAKYLSKLKKNGDLISSGLIRQCIEKGNIEKASHLLGRPYSLLLAWQDRPISLQGLCLLPEGEYRVSCLQKKKTYWASCKLSHNPPQLIIDFSSQTQKPTFGLLEVVFIDVGS